MISILLASAVASTALATEYTVKVTHVSPTPRISSVDGNTAYQQAFNPTWVQPTAGNGFKEGLLVRSQNCSSDVGGSCVACAGSVEMASVLTFAQLDDKSDEFHYTDGSSQVFGPFDGTDSWGTEDPRMQYNAADETYYMFYTAYNGTDIFLSLATTHDPTSPSTDNWTRYGAVFPSQPASKSAALLLKSNVPSGAPELSTNYLYWGDHDVRVTTSDDLTDWSQDIGTVLLSTREDMWDSQLVESGPPPLLLSTGDYLFFYNSAISGWPDGADTSYNVGYVILSGADPTKVLQRSDEPILSPDFAYQQGTAPYTCNMPNVVFLEAAAPARDKATGEVLKDTFTVYFGAADNTIGSGTVVVRHH